MHNIGSSLHGYPTWTKCNIYSLPHHLQRDKKPGTHHFKVSGATRLPTEQAGEQHFLDIMASSVRELPHVKRFGLEVAEICLLLQDLQLFLISHLGVRNLVPEGGEIQSIVTGVVFGSPYQLGWFNSRRKRLNLRCKASVRRVGWSDGCRRYTWDFSVPAVKAQCN